MVAVGAFCDLLFDNEIGFASFCFVVVQPVELNERILSEMR